MTPFARAAAALLRRLAAQIHRAYLAVDRWHLRSWWALYAFGWGLAAAAQPGTATATTGVALLTVTFALAVLGRRKHRHAELAQTRFVLTFRDGLTVIVPGRWSTDEIEARLAAVDVAAEARLLRRVTE